MSLSIAVVSKFFIVSYLRPVSHQLATEALANQHFYERQYVPTGNVRT